MKQFLGAATAVLLTGGAWGACPNSCSQRGTCSDENVCECFNGWTGGDCARRVCPYGLSWSTTSLDELRDDRYGSDVVMGSPGGYGVWADGVLDLEQAFDDLYPKVPGLRQYTECSSRGTCDYADGVCKCFDGYEGKACRRATCPNDCSGHGRCLTNGEVDFMYTSHTPFNDGFWDKDLSQQCVCDRGYEGWDCSQRTCPAGDDPTTACSDHIADDYQLVFVMRSNVNTEEYFTLEYEDNFGGEFVTRPIRANACVVSEDCPEVQYALLELPNLAIPNVEVDELDLSLGSGEHAFLVHFNDPANSGKQNTMACNTVPNPNVAGAAPKYNPTGACYVFDVGVPEWFAGDGTENTLSLNGVNVTMEEILGTVEDGNVARYEESTACSNQGICNLETGTCDCLEGATGVACEVQSTFV